MDIGPESPDLGRRMNSVALTVVGILVHKDHRGTTVGVNEGSSSNQGKVGDGLIANAGDMSPVKVRGRDDAHIRPSHATIGSPVDERT